MQLRYFLSLISICLCMVVQGQTVLTGKVTDKSGPIVGVNIFVLNSNDRVLTGVTTDTKGDYYLKIPSGEKLRVSFSFIGYKTKTIDFVGQKNLNLKLEDDHVQVEGVVVSGPARKNEFGVPQNNIGASVERLMMDNMDEIAVSSVEEMIQGRMANVDMVSSSGNPGSGMSIRIRGTSSLFASAEPLIVIDGIPQNIDISDDFDFASADAEDFGALVSVSPADILSIEVLKDAAATAVWGSRGGNGVLVITTKRGAMGKTKFSFSNKSNLNFEPKTMETLDGFQYVSMIQESLWNRALEVNLNANMAGLTHEQLVFNPNYVYNKEFNQNTDWLDEITRLGFSNETNFAMSGGGQRASYRFSLGYLNETGTTIGSDYSRINARLNIDYRFSKRLRLSAGISYSDGNKNEPFRQSSETNDDNNLSDIREHARLKMPNMSPYFMTEDGQRTNIYFTPESTLQGKWPNVYNPIALAHESTKSAKNRITNLTFALNYNILNSLKYVGDVGVNINTNGYDAYLPQTASGVNMLHADFNKSASQSQEGLALNINNKLIYDQKINDANRVIFTTLLQISDRQNSTYRLESSGVPSSEISTPANGAEATTYSGATSIKEMALVGVLHYNLLDRYMVTANYRYEGSSRISRQSRWASFPSVAVMWNISSEPFMKRTKKWLSDLSARASWGYNGNSPNGSYPYIGKFSALDNYGDLGAAGPSSIHLTALKWEKIEQKNIGVDASLFKNKVLVTVDLYDKLTTDLLQPNVTIPSVTGYDKVAYYNSGSMQNRGWEFRVEVKNIVKTKQFSLSASLNLASNKNKIVKLPDNINYMNYGEKAVNGRYAVTLSEGHPIGAFYGFNSLGVYKDRDATYVRDGNGALITDIAGNPIVMRHENDAVSAGDAIYRDVNQDGTINIYDIVYLGSGVPDLTGGFGIILQYKNWRLNTYFNARAGFKIINETRMKSESMYNYNNQSTAVLDRWRHEGDQTSIPRALFNRGLNWLGSDRFVEDGSFIRLQQLTLNYSFPKKIISKWGLSAVNCFITGYNLFTWTNYSGQDPEVPIKGGIYGGMGYDRSKSPRPRRVAFGFNFNF